MCRIIALLVAVAGLLPVHLARPDAHLGDSWTTAESERIRAHLARALAVLEWADTSALEPEQRDRRADVVARLREYRDRGGTA